MASPSRRRLLWLAAPLFLIVLLGAFGNLPGAEVAAHAPRATTLIGAAPTQVAHAERLIDGAGGVKLFGRSWVPTTGTPRATLVLVHGLRDYGARYSELAVQLAAQGFAVHAFDLRGHGRSSGVRVHVERFDEYLDDLDRVLTEVRAEEKGTPLFLFGHSMGGAITTRYVLERQPKIAGLVLSAPALKPGLDAPPPLISFVRVMSAAMPHLPLLKLDTSAFSRDAKVVAENESDPLVFQGNGSARAAAELLTALQSLEGRYAELEVPVLALHGTADTVTDPEGSRALIAQAHPADKTLKAYEGLAHDLLHEPERELVAADVIAWLEQRAPRIAPVAVDAP